MKHRHDIQVLVVGAGPVGMVAALRLVREGVRVQVIDEAEHTASRSGACGIHPATLGLFQAIGSAALNFEKWSQNCEAGFLLMDRPGGRNWIFPNCR